MRLKEKPDLDKIYKIYRFAHNVAKYNGYDFKFNFDSGNLETTIEIEDRLFQPDVIDHLNKIIIEFDETHWKKKNHGVSRMKRGHNELNFRDKIRNDYYSRAGYRYLILSEEYHNIEDNVELNNAISKFLAQCNSDDKN